MIGSKPESIFTEMIAIFEESSFNQLKYNGNDEKYRLLFQASFKSGARPQVEAIFIQKKTCQSAK